MGAGLPRVLVDLRHEATHNELPSLPLLRAAADAALAWLHATYWEPQQHTLRSAAERIATILRVRRCPARRALWRTSLTCTPPPRTCCCLLPDPQATRIQLHDATC